MRQWNNILGFVLIGLVLSACGDEVPPPAPVTPGTPGTPTPGVAVLGTQLEAPTPGTPLYQVQDPQVYQRMAQALLAQGQATIQQRSTIQYSVQPGSPAIWTPFGQPQQAAAQASGSFRYFADGYFGDDIEIQLTSPIFGARWFRFVQRYSLHGLILESTDQVALFESVNGPTTLLKIPYQAQNPSIYSFTIQPLWNQGGGVNYGGYAPQQQYGIQYLVTLDIYQTALQYPQQYQQPQFPQQQQYPQGNPNYYPDNGGYF